MEQRRIDVVLDDKKNRYWGKERNERRRQRYHADLEYRTKVQQQTRMTYRRLRDAEGKPARSDDCAENIPFLGHLAPGCDPKNPVYLGITRGVRMKDGSRKPMLTLTVEEMAKALNRNQQVLYRWFAADMFPRPKAMAETAHNQNQLVYLKSEAIAAMTEFSRHQNESQYYRERHTETRDRIFDAVDDARAALADKGVAI